MHRRDTPRGSTYDPVEVESDTARKGVNVRLFAAVGSLQLAVICVLGVILGNATTMAALAAFSIGFVAFNAGIALLLSARREESLHRLANEGPAGFLPVPEADGTDGEI